MPIEAAKCVDMHFGDTEINRYSIGEVRVPMFRPHKDLEATVSHNLKTTRQCREVAPKGFRMLWALRQIFTK